MNCDDPARALGRIVAIFGVSVGTRTTRMQPVAIASISGRRPIPAELVQDLGVRFHGRFSVADADRIRHGRDESPYETMPPDCVVFPATSTEVAEVVRLCAGHGVPVIAYGAGTSIEGHI